MSNNGYHKKVVKIITQSLDIDIQQPFKLHSSSSGVCSGFFISPTHIITCSHCVIHSKDIFFEIPSKGEKKYKLKIVGVCDDFDIALLESVEYKSKNYFKLGTLKDIKTGKEVYAIGFPLGQSNLKVTRGIISGIQFNSIQTDAPINKGNSGGPLIYNKYVIGINKSIITNSSNIGYATPITNFNVIKKELYNKDFVLIKRPDLGFTTNNTNESIQKLNGVKKGGVYVCDLIKNSPISNTNIEEGDIITKINDFDIDNYGLVRSIFTKNDKTSFIGIFDNIKLGETVRIEYYHNKKKFKKTFKYENYEMPIKYIYPRFEEIQYEIIGGVVFMDLYLNHLDIINYKTKKLPIELLKYYKTDERLRSEIVISYIYPNTYINNLDILSVGDIIRKVNDIEVSNMMEFRKAILEMIVFKNTKYLKFDTKDKKQIVLDAKSIINSEKNISETFKFELTKSYHYLKKKI
tara:strand:- start:844 stop:2232 length:1389 start_codon:yes stop_codon:yes gene_type:complete